MTRILLWRSCTLLLLLTAVTISTQLQQTAGNNNGPKITGAPQRPPRFVQANGLFGFFDALRSVKKLYDEQYNDTLVTLQSVMNTVADQFTDTATVKPAELMLANRTNGTTTTAKPKYRISRKELGYILGRNYRGLRKLFRIELRDAQNQTTTSLKDYRQEFGRAVSPYVVPKTINTTRTGQS